MKIVSVVGARPQFIKCASLSRELRKFSTEILVHTGQHYDDAMSGRFFEELEIPLPDYNLEIGSGTHGTQTGRMLEAIEKVLNEVRPNLVLVYGDTNSTFAGALAAAKMHISVAHVEAGLRSFNREMPEEINRVLTDHVSDILFTPSALAGRNLLREGIDPERIHEVGDVMYDAALHYASRASQQSTILQRLGLADRQSYVLVTIHRAENTDEPTRLQVIVEALAEVGREIEVIFTIHPRTRKALESLGLWEQMDRQVRPIPPIGYMDMLLMEKHAQLIITDSGGVQKEAFFCKVPCLTLRAETEWPELVSTGWNRLVSPIAVESILAAVRQSLGTKGDMVSLYGDGDAAGTIAKILASHAGLKDRGGLRAAQVGP